ncbi:pyrrolidone carboxyl peptidase, truncation [Streptococcus pneumoniae]|nr:pyrrolidone carboxyl peptidase, truncation [Streptococcus pneumoniae]
MNRYQPDFVLCIGQAGGRTSLTPERVAINQDDARISDNEDNQPIDRPIRPDGASAYFSSLPIKAMVQAIKKRAYRPLFQYGRDFCLQPFDVSGSLFGRKEISIC